MLRLLQDLVMEVAAFIEVMCDTKRSALINKAKQYIQENYNDGNLSLESVANNIGITKNYLSLLFKKEGGLTFSEYLKGIRMENATALLKTKQYYVYEVAEKTGYNNVTWFCTVFKRYTGISPTEYISS